MTYYEVEVIQTVTNRAIIELEAASEQDARQLIHNGDFEVISKRAIDVVDTCVHDVQCIDCEHGYPRGRGCSTCEALEHGDQQYHLARDEGRL
ncbi:hypothetical protein ACFLWA_03700 [Chloroflexota bacterium]